jgi:pantetheine-phosphate adenylyltransferase
LDTDESGFFFSYTVFIHLLFLGFFMKKVVFSGVFDPVTFGHVNIIERAAKMFPEVIVAVAESSSKQSMWSVAQRTQLMQVAVEHLTNVKVRSFSGLLVDFLKAQKVTTIIRGVRSVIDWSYEVEMADINHKMMPDVETLFLSAQENMSSTYVRQIWGLGGNVSSLVPPKTLELMKKFKV